MKGGQDNYAFPSPLERTEQRHHCVATVVRSLFRFVSVGDIKAVPGTSRMHDWGSDKDKSSESAVHPLVSWASMGSVQCSDSRHFVLV